jgi:hypothetical protein
MDMTLRDQGGGGVTLLLRDASQPYFYPAPTTGAARVVMYARDKGKGVDTAFIATEGKPGGAFAMPYAALTGRDLLFATVTYSASGTPSVSDLEHADWQELSVIANTANAAGIDEHVPSQPPDPIVTKAESADQWIVLTQFPSQYASTLTDCQIQVTKADDATVFTPWNFAPAPTHRIDQTAYPAKIKVRFRNQSTEDAGDGRGWSPWSNEVTAAEVGAAVPPPPAGGTLGTFDPDPMDSRAGIERGVIVG